MSHRPAFHYPDCEGHHTWTAWSTTEGVNAAGERCFVMERHCCACGLVEETSAAITEPPEPFTYAKTLNVGDRPDD